MSIAGKIGRATFTVTVAGLLSRIGSFLGTLVMVRRLGVEGMGALGLIESWLTLGMMFATVGIPTAATRHLAHSLEHNPNDVRALVNASLVLTLLFTLIIVGVGWVALSTSMVARTPLASLFAYRGFIIVLLLLYTLRALLIGFIYGLQAYGALIHANAAIGVAAPILTIWLVTAGNVGAALVVRILLTIIETLFIVPAVIRVARAHPSAEGHLLHSARRLLAFGFPTFIGQAVVSPIQTFALSFLAGQPNGMAQVGLLSTAQRLIGLANFLPASLSSTLTPILSGEWGDGQGHSFRQSLHSAIRLSWATTLPIVTACIAATPAMLGLLFGQEYLAASTITVVLFILMLMGSINEGADRALAASDRMWLSTFNNMVWTLLFVLLAFALVPPLLAEGYAFSHLLSFVLYVGVQFVWLRRLFALRLTAFGGLLVLSVAALMGAIAISHLPTYPLQIIGAICLSAVTSALTVRFVLAADERDSLGRLLNGLPRRLIPSRVFSHD